MHQSDAPTIELRDAGVEVAMRHLSEFVTREKSQIDEETAAEWDTTELGV
jgi:hypothetical protein